MRDTVDLYRSKAAVAERLEPLIGVLVGRGVSPDALTLAAVPVALIAAVALLLSPALPPLLLAVPLLAAARLILNLLDGAVARGSGRTHQLGEFYNEIGDRLADVAFLTPVAFLPGADRTMVLLGVIGTVFASYAGLASRAAGGARLYRGVLSKPGRMASLAIFSIAALLVGPSAWGPFGPLLLVGTLLTALERVILAIRRLT